MLKATRATEVTTNLVPRSRTFPFFHFEILCGLTGQWPRTGEKLINGRVGAPKCLSL